MDTLPDPPLIQLHLLEAPLSLVTLLGVLALVGIVWGYWRHHPRLRIGGVVGLTCAAGIYGLATLILTDREYLMTQTQHAVDLTVPLNTGALRQLLAPEATLNGPRGDVWLSLDVILKELSQARVTQKASGQEVIRIEGCVDSPRTGRTKLELRTTLKTQVGERPFKTLWIIHWLRDDKGLWRIEQVQWLEHPEPLGVPPKDGAWR